LEAAVGFVWDGALDEVCGVRGMEVVGAECGSVTWSVTWSVSGVSMRAVRRISGFKS
jgi:hypothetical protein